MDAEELYFVHRLMAESVAFGASAKRKNGDLKDKLA